MFVGGVAMWVAQLRRLGRRETHRRLANYTSDDWETSRPNAMVNGDGLSDSLSVPDWPRKCSERTGNNHLVGHLSVSRNEPPGRRS